MGELLVSGLVSTRRNPVRTALTGILKRGPVRRLADLEIGDAVREA
jgi:hypothetical protein